MGRTLRLIRRAFPDRGAFDSAVSRALLWRVGRGELPETLRVHRPGDFLAFSVADRRTPGFGRAMAAARAHGFEPVLRLAGGRAAVFHRETIAFAWTLPGSEPREGIERRFEEMADIAAAALRRLGVDARVGEVAGEYCPGAHSVNARGRTKIVGVGQRIVRGAAHVGGVVVVSGRSRVRDVLVPVYRELGLAFDPRTVGSVADEVGPLPRDRVAAALLAEFEGRFELVEGDLDPATLALAAQLEAQQRPESVAEVGETR